MQKQKNRNNLPKVTKNIWSVTKSPRNRALLLSWRKRKLSASYYKVMKRVSKIYRNTGFTWDEPKLLSRENTGQRKPVFWQILRSVSMKKIYYKWMSCWEYMEFSWTNLWNIYINISKLGWEKEQPLLKDFAK